MFSQKRFKRKAKRTNVSWRILGWGCLLDYSFNRAADIDDRYTGNMQASFNFSHLKHQKQAVIDLCDGGAKGRNTALTL